MNNVTGPEATAILVALKWVAGQELGRAHRNRERDLVAMREVLWPGQALSPGDAAEALRSEALEVLPHVALTSEQSAILGVLLGQQEIVRDAAARPPWRLQHPTRHFRIGEARRALIDALQLYCTADTFRRRHENPALGAVAAALTTRVSAQLPADEQEGVRLPRTELVLEDEPTREALAALGHDDVNRVLTMLFPAATRMNVRVLIPGMSGSSVFLVHPHAGHHLKACVVKIGPSADVKHELGAWVTYVQPYVRNKYLAGIQRHVVTGAIGGIAYEFVASTTLNQRLKDLAGRKDFSEIQRLLDKLFDLVASSWNVEKRREVRHLAQDDYRLTVEDLAAFDSVCAELPESLRPQPEVATVIRTLWTSEPSPLLGSHHVDLCHGDLYGENVLIDRDGDFCLIDFSHTRRQHYLRDFITLEGDLVLRLLPEGGAETADARMARALAQLSCAGARSFVEIPDRPVASLTAAVTALRVIRQRAWGRMEADEREIVSYRVGLVRRLVRSVVREENRLTNAQRWAGAVLALHHARAVAEAFAVSPQPAPVQPPVVAGRRSSGGAPLADKVRVARSLNAPAFRMVGGVYLDVILEPVETVELRQDEWSNLEPPQVCLGGSCLQVGRALFHRYGVKSLLFSAVGGRPDALSREAARLLSTERWIADRFCPAVSGAATAVSIHLRQGSGSFTSMFTHKGALDDLQWSRFEAELVHAHEPGSLLYIGGYFRTRLHVGLVQQLTRFAQDQIVVIDHGRMVPEVESGDAVQRLKRAFARDLVDVYLCTPTELMSLAMHPHRVSLPRPAERSPDVIAELARELALPPVTVVRDDEWPGPNDAYLLLQDVPEPVELITVDTASRRGPRALGVDDRFNAGFIHGLTRGDPDVDVWDAVREATREGLMAWGDLYA